ncbi:ABC transporter ATP-binding protein [Caproiciproducens sp.]
MTPDNKSINETIDKNVVLRTENMTMQFGGVVAVDNLHLTIREHQIVALIGPNGAGKTTAFNMITGVYTPSSGKIFLHGEDITGMSPDKITRRGVARTFQNIRLFKDLSVFDNIIIAKHFSMKSNLFSATLRLPGAVRAEKRMRKESEELLERMGLADVKDAVASSLPYGQQRHLEIARALATKPELLLLDEPAAGMNPQETEDLTASIKQIQQDFNLTVFLIEHHMDLVMEISDRIYVLDFGQTIGKGTPAEIQNNPRVVEAYLGVDEDAEN